jgi:hypothetical protein
MIRGPAQFGWLAIRPGAVAAHMSRKRDVLVYPGGHRECTQHDHSRDIASVGSRGAIRLALVHGYDVRGRQRQRGIGAPRSVCQCAPAPLCIQEGALDSKDARALGMRLALGGAADAARETRNETCERIAVGCADRGVRDGVRDEPIE